MLDEELDLKAPEWAAVEEIEPRSLGAGVSLLALACGTVASGQQHPWRQQNDVDPSSPSFHRHTTGREEASSTNNTGSLPSPALYPKGPLSSVDSITLRDPSRYRSSELFPPNVVSSSSRDGQQENSPQRKVAEEKKLKANGPIRTERIAQIE